MRITVINHLTLDGVMQAPGRSDEDTRDGFEHGGWSVPYGDQVMGEVLDKRMSKPDGGLLLGRRTYEDLLSYWNTQPESPFTPALNNTPKHIASTTLTEPLEWPHANLLRGDTAHAVAALKAKSGGDLAIMGSGMLIQTLIRHDLIDEYLLMIHPLVLGTGHRLFADGVPHTPLRLVDSTTTTTGVLIATYQPA